MYILNFQKILKIKLISLRFHETHSIQPDLIRVFVATQLIKNRCFVNLAKYYSCREMVYETPFMYSWQIKQYAHTSYSCLLDAKCL